MYDIKNEERNIEMFLYLTCFRPLHLDTLTLFRQWGQGDEMAHRQIFPPQLRNRSTDLHKILIYEAVDITPRIIRKDLEYKIKNWT